MEKTRNVAAKHRKKQGVKAAVRVVGCVALVGVVILLLSIGLTLNDGETVPAAFFETETTTTTTALTRTTTTTTTTTTTATTATTTTPWISPLRGRWHQTGESPAEVEVLLQNPELPTGCEATAATMLLKAYGYPVSMVGLAQAIPKTTLETHDGRRYAQHPSEAFLGDPATVRGYGIFPGALQDTLQTVIREAGGPHTVKVWEGAVESEILAFVDSGHPLLVWSTMYLEEIVPLEGWYIKRDGEYTDEYFLWPGKEHCYVLLAYDDSYVTVADPLRGEVRLPRARFFRLFRELGGYALSLE